MERPDIDAIERDIRTYWMDVSSNVVNEMEREQKLINWIRHLESTQPKGGEPYCVQHYDYDDEVHETLAVVRDWIVVRDKVREEEGPRFYVGPDSVNGVFHVYDAKLGDYRVVPSKEEAQEYADWKNGQES